MDLMSPIIDLISNYFIFQSSAIVFALIVLINEKTQIFSKIKTFYVKRKVSVWIILGLIMLFGLPELLVDIDFVLYLIMLPFIRILIFFPLSIIYLLVKLINRKLGIRGLISLILINLVWIIISYTNSVQELIVVDGYNNSFNVTNNSSTNNSNITVSGGIIYDQ